MGLESAGFRILGLHYPNALKETLGLSAQPELSPVTLSSVPLLLFPHEERQDPGLFFSLPKRYEGELSPVQTAPPDRRRKAAEKLCQALLKFQAGNRRVEAASGGRQE